MAIKFSLLQMIFLVLFWGKIGYLWSRMTTTSLTFKTMKAGSTLQQTNPNWPLSAIESQPFPFCRSDNKPKPSKIPYHQYVSISLNPIFPSLISWLHTFFLGPPNQEGEGEGEGEGKQKNTVPEEGFLRGERENDVGFIVSINSSISGQWFFWGS